MAENNPTIEPSWGNSELEASFLKGLKDATFHGAICEAVMHPRESKQGNDAISRVLGLDITC